VAAVVEIFVAADRQAALWGARNREALFRRSGSPECYPRATMERFSLSQDVPGGIKVNRDSLLVERYLGGDMEAFSELYRRYVGAVSSTVRRYIVEHDSVQEIVQEAFVRAMSSLPELQKRERLKPWLLSIARHVALDECRSRSRFVPVDGDAAAAVPDDQPGPEALAEGHDLALLLRGFIAGLSRRDATALVLTAQLGLSPKELGAALNVSPGAAKVIVHRARQRLREAVVVALLSQRSKGTCSAFIEAVEENNVVEASKHATSCSLCQKLLRDEGVLYTRLCPTHKT